LNSFQGECAEAKSHKVGNCSPGVIALFAAWDRSAAR
jgi:hypothetical protein